jgi:hypothetical protein
MDTFSIFKLHYAHTGNGGTHAERKGRMDSALHHRDKMIENWPLENVDN